MIRSAPRFRSLGVLTVECLDPVGNRFQVQKSITKITILSKEKSQHEFSGIAMIPCQQSEWIRDFPNGSGSTHRDFERLLLPNWGLAVVVVSSSSGSAVVVVDDLLFDFFLLLSALHLTLSLKSHDCVLGLKWRLLGHVKVCATIPRSAGPESKHQ